MKKTLRIIIIAIIVLGLLIGIYYSFFEKESKKPIPKQIEIVTLSKENLTDLIKLKKNNIEINVDNPECLEELCRVTLHIINKSSNKIDLTDYRISFFDNDKNEIEWYNGMALGIINANDSMESTIEISAEKWNNTTSFVISNND